MLLQLTEILRCPADHEESYVVCVTHAVEGTRVLRGVVGCPVCKAEYPIVDGVVDFTHQRTGAAAHQRTGAPAHREPLTAEAAATFLGLRGPGGYVLLAGTAARLAGDLAAFVPGVHVVCVNAPNEARSPSASYLLAEGGVPLKSSWMRGVVLGADCAGEPWLGEGVRTLLDGLRLVVEDEAAEVPGVVEMARGAGVSVWERRAR